MGDEKKSPITPQQLLDEKEIESPTTTTSESSSDSGLDEEQLTELSEAEEVAIAITNSSDIGFVESLRAVAGMPRAFVMGLRRRIRRSPNGLTEIPMELELKNVVADEKDLEAQIPRTATLTQYMNRLRRQVPALVERGTEEIQRGIRDIKWQITTLRRNRMLSEAEKERRIAELEMKQAELERKEARVEYEQAEMGWRGERIVPPSLYNQPRGDMNVPTGVIAGAIGGSIAGGAMGGARALVPAGIAGMAAGGLTDAGIIEYYRRRGIPITDKLKKQAKLAGAVVAGGAGLATGLSGAGKGVVSGAGITEQKINVDADVLKATQAKESQDVEKNKQWAPKIIAPTPAILDKPAQEMYAEDLEASLFNYVAPTSEGADGTVFTNQLKRNQYMNEQLRYYKSGVFVPAKLWEQMNTPENMSKEKLDRMALGQKPLIELPQMEFIPQNNETTFETVADKQYVNGEPDSIEFLSAYSSYSNVDNYWATNAQSNLYTINP